MQIKKAQIKKQKMSKKKAKTDVKCFKYTNWRN